MGSGALAVTNSSVHSELWQAQRGEHTPRAPRPTRLRDWPVGSRYFDAPRKGAVVGCGLPPSGSSVTATVAGELFGSAWVACIVTSPSGLGMKVPALIFAVGVTSQS